MDIQDILKTCDHTLLRVDASSAEIKQLCDQAIKYRCASVCIPPCHVAGAKRYVGDRMRICTVIGFPNGYCSTAVKAYETADAIQNGADEVDMVINLSMVKDKCWDEVKKDITAVRKASEGNCDIVSECHAEYIKTSTGFSSGGATREDVKLMRTRCPASVKVKAAGGIATLQDAEDFLTLGAERLGTSRIVKLAMELEKQNTIE